MRKLWLRVVLHAAVLGVVVLGYCVPARSGFDENWFLLLDYIYGQNAYVRPECTRNLDQHLANSLGFNPPFSPGFEKFLTDRKISTIFQMFGSRSTVGSGVGIAAFDQRSADALSRFAKSPGATGIKVIWDPMPEFDQSGGRWANPRPRYRGLTREQAHRTFVEFFTGPHHAPLGSYLKQTLTERGYFICPTVDYPCHVAAAYEMGADMVQIERSIDELSDISTGIAFLRGLSRQYDKPWGIDVSTWRTSNDAATRFDAQGRLLGGWSPSYLSRHFYIAYVCGANILSIEPTVYGAGPTLNPFGEMCKEFGDLSLVRHKDVGRPVVNMALMLNFYNGFDPKHGLHNQGDAVWYWEIPYSDSDHMINNFFKVAYPDHWLHGLTPAAPFDGPKGPDVKRFKTYLAEGGDPRPYEPMGQTRYGDNLDIIYNNASAATLAKYRVIALIGDVPLNEAMRPRLEQWVENGGILVVNAKQATPEDEAFLGVKLSRDTGKGTSSRWAGEDKVIEEKPFTYTKVMPASATVVATNNGSDPLVTSNKVGKGEVILSTPAYLQTAAKDALLNVGVKLFDTLETRYAIAKVIGAPVEYIVNRGIDKTIVTVVNNSATEWKGTIEMNKPPSAYNTREWRSDQAVANRESSGKVTLSATVPAYEVRIYAMEY